MFLWNTSTYQPQFTVSIPEDSNAFNAMTRQGNYFSECDQPNYVNHCCLEYPNLQACLQQAKFTDQTSSLHMIKIQQNYLTYTL